MSRIIKKNVVINDNEVIKKSDKSLLELFDYLQTRSFDNYPRVLDYDSDSLRVEYVESKDYYEMSKGIELIKTMSILHYKTMFFKDVSKNKYRNIYDKLSNNIDYLKKYYLDIIQKIENTTYMSPSQYLIARNYSIINSSLEYASKELKSWFKLVENKSKERVCVVHNNVTLDHFIRGDKNYFISWDKHLVDTPVLDIYNFYKKDGYKLDFNLLLDEYNKHLELLEEEKKLLKILISIPIKIDIIDNEYFNTVNIKNTFDYLYSCKSVVNSLPNSIR